MDREPTRITAEDAAKDIHDVLARARDGEAFAVTDAGRTIAEIAPPTGRKTVAEFLKVVKSKPLLSPEDGAAFEKDFETIRRSDEPAPSKWD